MRIFWILSLILISCSHSNLSTENHHLASGTMAQGQIRAAAVKKMKHQNLCFEINLLVKNAEAKFASPRNWTVAWTDKKSKFHLLVLTQRDPASVPQGENDEWSNRFVACVGKAGVKDVESLILTPKELPYEVSEELHLKWN